MRYRANLIGLAMVNGLAAGAVAWGWFDAGGRIDPYQPGHATAVFAGAIGLLLLFPLFLRALQIPARVASVRANPEGRWFVGPAAIASYLEWERRNGIVNEWRPTRSERANGIEVCWAGEVLLVGGHYRLVAYGQSVRSVEGRLAPPGSVALRYGQHWSRSFGRMPRLIYTLREFRFPAPDEAQARALVRHFNELLDAGPTRDWPRRRARLVALGWIVTAIFVVMLIGSFALAWHDRTNGIFRPTGQRAALMAMMVAGVIGTLGTLPLALSLRRRRDR